MNYPRVTIEINRVADKEYISELQAKYGVAFQSDGADAVHYTIRYNNPEDKPLQQDSKLTQLIFDTIKAVRAVVGRFSHPETDEMFRYTAKWVKLALNDPLLTARQREVIEETFPIVPIKKSSEFQTELVERLAPLVAYLEQNHKGHTHLTRKDVRGLLIEYLHGLMPDVPAIQKLEDNDGFEKAIRNALLKTGNN